MLDDELEDEYEASHAVPSYLQDNALHQQPATAPDGRISSQHVNVDEYELPIHQ